MKDGYTLLELLIVLSIISILFAGSFVSYREFSRRQALLVVTRSLKADLRVAQEQALAGKKTGNCGTLTTPPYILVGYNFRIVSSGIYQIGAVCSKGSDVYDCVGDVNYISDATLCTKRVDLSGMATTIGSTYSNPLLFKILGNETDIPIGTTLTYTLTQSVSGDSQTVMVEPGGEIK